MASPEAETAARVLIERYDDLLYLGYITGQRKKEVLEVITALGRTGAMAAVNKLQTMLGMIDEDIRCAAIQALGEIGQSGGNVEVKKKR